MARISVDLQTKTELAVRQWAAEQGLSLQRAGAFLLEQGLRKLGLEGIEQQLAILARRLDEQPQAHDTARQFVSTAGRLDVQRTLEFLAGRLEAIHQAVGTSAQRPTRARPGLPTQRERADNFDLLQLAASFYVVSEVLLADKMTKDQRDAEVQKCTAAIRRFLLPGAL
jgi:hypothetical protein